MSKTVVFAVGGSGGHLIPAQVIAKELQQADSAIRVHFLGQGLSQCPFFDSESFASIDIPSSTLNFKKPFSLIKSSYKLLKGLWLCLQFFSQAKPKLVVGFGSYHSLPVVAAARLKKIPLVLFESNIYPGSVNRYFANSSKAVLVPYTECRKYLKAPMIQVKMPLRTTRDESDQAREKAAEYLGLSPKVTTIVVFGGSQGARTINDLAVDSLEMFADRRYPFQVIHLCGHEAQTRSIQDTYSRMRIKAYVKEFDSMMHHVWAMADLAICRIGAMTLAELIEFEVPAIVIPYPYAKDDHQNKNGDFLVEQVAGGIKLKEELASPEKILAILLELFKSKSSSLKNMRTSLRDYKSTMPSKTVVSCLLEYM